MQTCSFWGGCHLNAQHRVLCQALHGKKLAPQSAPFTPRKPLVKQSEVQQDLHQTSLSQDPLAWRWMLIGQEAPHAQSQ